MPSRVESVSPSPEELLHSSQMFWGLLPPMPDPPGWEPNVGSELTPVGEPEQVWDLTIS